eukprot:543960-Pyramimonas_sp.AAC.1
MLTPRVPAQVPRGPFRPRTVDRAAWTRPPRFACFWEVAMFPRSEIIPVRPHLGVGASRKATLVGALNAVLLLLLIVV